MAQLVKEFEDSATDSGVLGGQVADVGVGEIGIGENVVAEHFHEIAGQPSIVAFGQFARLDAKIPCDPEQQWHGDAATVVFDQVEIGRGNLQRFGQLRLADRFLAPQPLDTAPDLQIELVHCPSPICKSLQSLQFSHFDFSSLYSLTR